METLLRNKTFIEEVKKRLKPRKSYRTYEVQKALSIAASKVGFWDPIPATKILKITTKSHRINTTIRNVPFRGYKIGVYRQFKFDYSEHAIKTAKTYQDLRLDALREGVADAYRTIGRWIKENGYERFLKSKNGVNSIYYIKSEDMTLYEIKNFREKYPYEESLSPDELY